MIHIEMHFSFHDTYLDSCVLRYTDIYLYFEVKLTIGMLTVYGQQHLFSTYKRMFLGNCQRFRDRKRLDLRGNQTPNLRIHAEWGLYGM